MALGEHGPGAVRNGGQQVRDEPVFPGRAAHRLPVDRDGGQPARTGQRERDRAGARAGGQVRPGVMRQRLRAQSGEDPHHGVRVRRHADPQGVPAGPGRGQHLLRRGVHPGGHVLHRRVPAQHRRRAQRQHARQGMPDPARVPRIRDRREALQQVPADAARQRSGARGQLLQGFPSGSGHGHARLGGQRGLPGGEETSAIPCPSRGPAAPPQRHAHARNVT